MKNNKVIFKINKYDLGVTYFLAVSLSEEPSQPLSIEIGLLVLEILKEKQKNSEISEHIGKCTMKVIIGIHYTYPQNKNG